MKEAWIQNIPRVTAYLTEVQTPYKDNTTPEGIYNIKLILTGDKNLAEDACTKRKEQILNAQLGHGVAIE